LVRQVHATDAITNTPADVRPEFDANHHSTDEI
jgi:hypothetical protein